MKVKKLRKTISAFQKSRIILSAFELGLFTTLGEKQKNLDEITQETAYDKRALSIILNALCSIKILKKKNGKYSNSKTAEKLLVKGKPGFMGNLYHTNSLWKTWSNLTDIVKNGSPQTHAFTGKREGNWVEEFIAAMHSRAKTQAPQTADLINLSKVNTMLDVGGGSGIFCMAFINKNPKIKATVFDLPNVLPTSIKYIENEGYKDKIDVFAGNYLTDNFPGKYDLILLSAVIHINSFDENTKLIKKCASSLNPGGQIIVSDFILNEDKTGPERAALFAVNMLAGTKSGNTYTESEIKSMFKNANIKFEKRIDTNFQGTIITGIKF